MFTTSHDTINMVETRAIAGARLI
uniref:Uncharacterized protein n=1 Tax=Arundo donax TaxID=35708 RepID=A0A0A9BMR9_ARUDO